MSSGDGPPHDANIPPLPSSVLHAMINHGSRTAATAVMTTTATSSMTRVQTTDQTSTPTISLMISPTTSPITYPTISPTSTTDRQHAIAISKPVFIAIATIIVFVVLLALASILYLTHRILKARRARRAAAQWGRQTRYWGAQTIFLDQQRISDGESHQRQIDSQEHPPPPPPKHPLQQQAQRSIRQPPHYQPSHRRVSLTTKAIDDAFRAKYTGVLMPAVPENPELGNASPTEVWGERRLEGEGVWEVPNVPAGARGRAIEERERRRQVEDERVRRGEGGGAKSVAGTLADVVLGRAATGGDGQRGCRRGAKGMSLAFVDGVGMWVPKR